MEEIVDKECKEYSRAVVEQFLLDHLRNKVLDDLTYEELLENLRDYL